MGRFTKAISSVSAVLMLSTAFVGSSAFFPSEQAHAAASVNKVEAGSSHSVVLQDDGTLVAWGKNSYGALGDGTQSAHFAFSSAPIVPGLTGKFMTSVSAGNYTTFAIDSTGSVYSWGKNDYGQLGDGTVIAHYSPAIVPGLSNISKVTSKYNHTLVIDRYGKVYGLGLNTTGQVGDGTLTSPIKTATPVQGFPSGTIITQVETGTTHSLALDKDGNAYAWGYGQLGNNTTTTSKTPVKINNVPKFVSIAAGGAHSLALDVNGVVYQWGTLNDGLSTKVLVPTQVAGLPTISAIAEGDAHSLALDTAGNVWTWGLNTSGQLGDGTKAARTGVYKLTNLTGVIGIDAGAAHSIALTKNGQVYSWGAGGNLNYQIGPSGTTDPSVPVLAPGFNSVAMTTSANPSETGVALSYLYTGTQTIAQYVVSRNGVEVYRGTNTSFTDSNLFPSTVYTYKIDAYATGATTPLVSRTLAVTTTVSSVFDVFVTATANGPTAANVTYTGSRPVDSYVVYRNGVEVYRGTSSSYADTNLNPATTYTYKVEAYANGNTTPLGSKTTTVTTPDVPAEITVSHNPTTNSITLSVGSSNKPDATFVVTSTYETYPTVTEVYRGPAGTFTHSGLYSSKQYNYKIEAYLPGQTQPSGTKNVTLYTLDAAPTLTGSASGKDAHSMNVIYASNKSTLGMVTIARNTPNGPVEIARFTSDYPKPMNTNVTLTDTGLQPNTTYSYTINTYGYDKVTLTGTQTVTGKTLLELFDVKVTATSSNIYNANISWTTIKQANYYVVERGGKEVYRGMATSFADILTPTGRYSNSYGYQVYAYETPFSLYPLGMGYASFSTNTETPVVITTTLKSTAPNSVTVTTTPSRDNGSLIYTVKRDGQQVYKGPNRVFVDTGLTASTTYRYDVSVTETPIFGTPVATSNTVTTPAANFALNLTSTATSYSAQITATANQAVETYVFYRDGKQVYSGTGAVFTDSGLRPGRTYSYQVEVYAAGNTKALGSKTIYVTTPVPSNMTSLVVDSYDVWTRALGAANAGTINLFHGV